MNVIQFPNESSRIQEVRACLEVAIRNAISSMTDEQLTKLVKEPLATEVQLAQAA